MREIDRVITFWRAAAAAGKRCALGTVVYVEGHSYRKPGARMLVTDGGQSVGSVSGGCVERAVAQRAERVLATGTPEMLVYDGRYRLGCEGTLHILVEPFAPADPDDFFAAYAKTRGADFRGEFTTSTTANVPAFHPEAVELPAGRLGSVFYFSGGRFAARPSLIPTADGPGVFRTLGLVESAPRLFAVGAERDAVALASLAATQGWGATLVTHPRNPLGELDDVRVESVDPPELLRFIQPDVQTAVVLMSHNYARDLAYLRSLSTASEIGYLGLLGPHERRDQLIGDLVDAEPQLPAWFDERVYGPAGIDLGGELPEQVALSIMAEVVAVFAERPVPHLRDKRGAVHDSVAEGLSA